MRNMFRREVLAQRSSRLNGNIVLAHPTSFKSLTGLILLMVVVSLTFLGLGKYSKKDTVSGYLQPSKGIIKLEAPQAGSVATRLVEEGEHVEKGQPLLILKSEQHDLAGTEINQALIDEYQSQFNQLRQQIIEQPANAELQFKQLSEQKQSLVQHLQKLQLQRKLFQHEAKINQEIVNQIKDLEQVGYMSEWELKKQQMTALTLQRQLVDVDTQELTVNSQLQEIEYQFKQLPIENAENLVQLQTRLSNVEISLLQARQQATVELRAAADGTVTGLLVKTSQSVVQGQALLSIIPTNSDLQAVLYVPTQAVGFIQKSQLVKLRYHAFAHQRFGLYQGQIDEISSNIILPQELNRPELVSSPSYRIIVSLQQQAIRAYGKTIPLRPGMSLDADIIGEQRSLLRWLFDPVYSIQGSL